MLWATFSFVLFIDWLLIVTVLVMFLWCFVEYWLLIVTVLVMLILPPSLCVCDCREAFRCIVLIVIYVVWHYVICVIWCCVIDCDLLLKSFMIWSLKNFHDLMTWGVLRLNCEFKSWIVFIDFGLWVGEFNKFLLVLDLWI